MAGDRSDSMECNVCYDAPAASVTCATCSFPACVACIKTYLTSTPDARCMKCGHEWDRAFLADILGQRWIDTEHKRRRQDALFDLERARFPITQGLVGRYREAKRLRDGGIQAFRDAYHRAREAALAASRRADAEWDRLVNALDEIRWMQNPVATTTRHATANDPECPLAVCGCPVEACRGIVMSDTHACGLCSTKICAECHERLVDDHVCDKATKDTVRQIMKSSKACPTCAARVTRVSGCYQMWCTACNTAFDYNTGLRTHGPVHNPHYFEWIRRQNIDDDPGRFQGRHGPCRADTRRIESQLSPIALDIVQRARHLHAVEVPVFQFRARPVDDVRLRLMYLDGEITEKEYRLALHRAEKRRLKIAAFRDIIEMFSTVVQDILQTSKNGADAETRLLGIRDYANEQLERVKPLFGMRMHVDVFNVEKVRH